MKINDELKEYIENKVLISCGKNDFRHNGYAKEKMYFEDFDYKKFLEDISVLA